MKAVPKRLVYLLGFVAVAGAVLVALRPAPLDVDLGQVSVGRLQVTVEEDGKTRIRDRYVVSAPLAGLLLRIEMDPGDPVSRTGSPLAAIAPRNPELLDARERAAAEARVKSRQTALERATPDMEKARAALEYAESDLARLRRVVAANAASADQLAQAEMRYRVYQEEFRAARFNEIIARYELQMAEAALVRSRAAGQGNGGDPSAEFELHSPIDGRVLRVFQQSSTVVTPGMPLLEVGDPEDLEVEIDVLSTDAVRIQPGAEVMLERWGGDQALEGRVRLVEPSAFTKISALGVEEQRVNVIVDFVSPPADRSTLGDGFRVEARIVVWQDDAALRVPTAALFRHGSDWAVFRLQGDRAVLTQIALGRRNTDHGQVLSGLRRGDRVVLHPSDQLRDGARVRERASP